MHRVLNAFRRHRLGHPGREPAQLEPVRRAQRLSASSSGSLDDRRPCDRDVEVLNAFRHHRLGHPWSAAHRPGMPGAQRLSASSSGSPRSPRRSTRTHASAQRLSASSSGSRGRGQDDPPLLARAQRLSASSSGARLRSVRARPDPQAVLNAFRRHRLGHPDPRRPPSGLRRVLNAFRRHRLGHPSSARIQRHRLVLNAFRRHRLGHRPAPNPCDYSGTDDGFQSPRLHGARDAASTSQRVGCGRCNLRHGQALRSNQASSGTVLFRQEWPASELTDR